MRDHVLRAEANARRVFRAARRRSSRAVARLRSETLCHEAAGELLFGQQHLGTRDFLVAHFGQYHTVALPEFPHTRFFTDPNQGMELLENYLEQSWSHLGLDNTSASRRKHMEKFEQRKALVASGKFQERPTLIFKRRDGRRVIADGNHRAAIAYALNRPLPVRELAARQWLTETATRSSRFYGSAHRGMPYQSLFDSDRELVRGRRRDTNERFEHIRIDELGHVLDLGCNIGATAYMAADRGADSVVGLEVDPQMVSTAIRLNTYFAAPVDFFVHNLNEPFRPSFPVDTLMCFSVAAHLETHTGLAETIRHSGAKVMYFEGHAGTSRDDYPDLLTGELFRQIELVGDTGSSNPGSTARRPVFRCVAVGA